jgi:hypothetical protein
MGEHVNGWLADFLRLALSRGHRRHLARRAAAAVCHQRGGRLMLGLGTDDGRNIRWVGEPADGWLRLSSLLGMPVATRHGRQLGHVRDVRAQRVDGRCVVTGVLVGRAGILQRLGVTKEQRLERRSDAEAPPNFVRWARLTDVASNGFTVCE